MRMAHLLQNLLSAVQWLLWLPLIVSCPVVQSLLCIAIIYSLEGDSYRISSRLRLELSNGTHSLFQIEPAQNFQRVLVI